ncbi:hypothetical protein BDZ45DRAFT_721327 [Acephala macrosclerotiorum]|nr:hypothetical protein BDZ45DRAFT_721327 [Acephala macrosclerotiorum]
MKSSTVLYSLQALGAHATPLGAKASRNSVSLSYDSGLKIEVFNILGSVFKSDVVKGDGLVFSDLIQLLSTTQSLADQVSKFDTTTNTKAFKVTISDKSIFLPKAALLTTLLVELIFFYPFDQHDADDGWAVAEFVCEDGF